MPGLIISLAKKDLDAPNKYKIYEMNVADVEYYNSIIFKNGGCVLSKNEEHLRELVTKYEKSGVKEII